MNIQDIQTRLLALLRTRVQNGELTERGFARSIGISQGHIHNVLKGRRSLSVEKSDLILQYFNYSMLDLLKIAEIDDHLTIVSTPSVPSLDLPFLVGVLGPGMPSPRQVGSDDRHPIPCVVANSARNPQLLRLSKDPEMDYTGRGHNIAVLDVVDRDMTPDAIYAVDRGYDTVLRRVRPGLNNLYLATDADLDTPIRWQPVSRSLERSLFRGQVHWFGTERPLKPTRSR